MIVINLVFIIFIIILIWFLYNNNNIYEMSLLDGIVVDPYSKVYNPYTKRNYNIKLIQSSIKMIEIEGTIEIDVLTNSFIYEYNGIKNVLSLSNDLDKIIPILKLSKLI